MARINLTFRSVPAYKLYRSLYCILNDGRKFKKMDNAGIVVESLDKAIAFFTELGLKLEGRATVEGEWAGRVTGLGDQNVEIAMMVTPDGRSRLELSLFNSPSVVSDHRAAPVNALGYLRAMFMVRSLLAKWFSMSTHAGFATFAELKEF
ncbi:VOC family protein [Mucilaginibacter aquariorum]|uniref:Glyoxalase/fosfomycin resistance/dioxygenase domain-containing protein n=1 Tax=Mucilaginibacter aquariorum TaxID=2967225 RepID=A0ABT1SYA9_9SPHI|nr:VOC family protein [Mucilaginibacter aquariorum]MCQ6957247.1 hypothetical protein [Mucilaginibacter aquariorum]